MEDVKRIQKFKIAVSITLLCLCVVFVFMCAIGIFIFKDGVFLSSGATAVRIELQDEVTLEDNTKDKLVKKLKLTGETKNCEIGELVKVTQSGVMFNYYINRQEFCLSAIGKNIKKISVATYADTTGDISISNESELRTFRNNVNNDNWYLNTTIKLLNDISLSNTWVPIGYGSAFWGTFDGCGHTISHINISSTSGDSYTNTNSYSYGAGFFGNLASGATIKNLAIKNVSINIAKEKMTYYVGSLVGCAYKGVTITNCSVFNSKITLVQGDGSSVNAGGLLGSTKFYRNDTNNVTISDCYVECSISVETKKESNTACAGGVVGSFDADTGKLTISKCLYKGSLIVKKYNSDSKAARLMVASGIVGAGLGISDWSKTSNLISISNCLSYVLDNSTVESGTLARCFATTYSGCYAHGSSVIIFGHKVTGYSFAWLSNNNYYVDSNAPFSTGSEANGTVSGDATGYNQDYNKKSPSKKSISDLTK